ncbi:Hsp20/alpha crystallin family protein [Verrucomicrobium spinosum]|uniref:Hsp20/alpha crystallin family protein n=1 Tax=Verrucomicrobium spinosum TaxID=2736 RepID=UPI000174569C|nr:Hsp20/alpha crystallin family protein [Verrucomicrobium spinosum]
MNTLTRWTPFRTGTWDPLKEISEMENRLSRLFPTAASNGGAKEALTVAEWAPPVDITEDDKEYVIKAELPEIKKEDVKVTVTNGELTLAGQRKFEKEEEGKKYHRVERSYGSFLRSFTLPDAVDATKVEAQFKDGILTVHLPKDERAKPKSVEVKLN